MKQRQLLLLCALLLGLARANWEEMVKVIDATVVSQVAGAAEADFVNADDEKSIAPLTTGNFPKAKEELHDFAKTEPPKAGQISQVHKLKRMCLTFDKTNLFEPLFCYEIWIKPAAVSGPPGSKPNKKMFTVLVYLVNSVVTSRIKITLSTGSGNQIIRRILTRGIVKYLAKADQTLSTLKTFLPELQTELPKLLVDVGNVIGRDKAPVKFSTDFFNPVVGQHTAAEFTPKALIEGDGKDGPKLDEAAEENAPVFKLFQEQKAAHKFVPRDGGAGPVAAEFAVVKIRQEIADGEFNEIFADFVKQVFLVVANIEGRFSVHIRSDVFSFSRDLPVASRQLLLQTVQRLLERAMVETYLSFYVLDMNRPQNLADETMMLWFRALMEGLDAPVPFQEQQTDSNEFIADFLNYKIQVRGYIIPGHGDFLVRVLLNREGEPVLDRMNYFPLKSQYILVPLMQSFIQKTCNEYYETIYAGLVIPGKSPDQSGDGKSAVVSAGKFALSPAAKELFHRKMALAAHLVSNRVVPFVPETNVQVALDTSLKTAEAEVSQGKPGKVVAYNLRGAPDHEKQKGLVMKVKKVKTEEFETTQVTEVETRIMKQNGIVVRKSVVSRLKEYEVVRNSGETLTYEQVEVQ